MQTPEAAPQVGPAPVMEQSVQEANNVMTPEVEPTPQPVNLYNNNRPDFVRDTEPKAFVHDDIPDTHKPLPNLNPGGSMDLDVPDATALSDMNN